MLATGTRLGPYEIRGLIGEGGMGRVYRAADTRLDRAVAIKVLPASLAADPTRRERFERGPLSITHTLEYRIQIADALAAAHRAGIVHRDLKPANVMLTRTGARLLDFGLARTVAMAAAPGHVATPGLDATTLTTQGTLLGTLHYMAPEQLDGREVDTRADVSATSRRASPQWCR